MKWSTVDLDNKTINDKIVTPIECGSVASDIEIPFEIIISKGLELAVKSLYNLFK